MYEKSSLQLSTIKANHLHLIVLFDPGFVLINSLSFFALSSSSLAFTFTLPVHVSSTIISTSSL